MRTALGWIVYVVLMTPWLVLWCLSTGLAWLAERVLDLATFALYLIEGGR
jgi:hypothetical protein